MQPETPRAPIGSEQAPVPVAPTGERIPVLPTPEAGLEVGLERTEQAAEASAAAADFAAPVMPVAPPPIAATPPATTDDNPVTASDDDVIEKEWVDKAKKIIQETKDDPYARSSRVNELQRDYLKKRYAKELGASE